MTVTRLWPAGVFDPAPGLYSQLVSYPASFARHEIAGTVGRSPDGTVPSDMAGQARELMANIGHSLATIDLTPAAVVRITIYTTDIDAFLAEAADTVFGFFGSERPTSTLVQVVRLADPRYLLEISTVAVGQGLV
jgi:2-iminobutanoate/2-iminopropanoate deaminase